MTPSSRKSTVAAGWALILFPVLAIVLKMSMYAGWMLMFILFASLPLLAGYILQVIIATVSMLKTSGVFNTMPGNRRGVIAAWITSGSVLACGFFLVDGGDDGNYGSAFTLLIGSSSTAAGEQLSMAFFIAFVCLWLGGWIWLVAEWILLGVRAKKLAQATR